MTTPASSVASADVANRLIEAEPCRQAMSGWTAGHITE
jgi:hypothetical protein